MTEYIFQIRSKRRCSTEIANKFSDIVYNRHEWWPLDDYRDAEFEYMQSEENDIWTIPPFLNAYHLHYSDSDFDFEEYFTKKELSIEYGENLTRTQIQKLIDTESSENIKQELMLFLKRFLEDYLNDYYWNNISDNIDDMLASQINNWDDYQNVAEVLGITITIIGWVDEYCDKHRNMTEGFKCPNCEEMFSEEQSKDEWEQAEQGVLNTCYCPHCGDDFPWDNKLLHLENKQYDDKFWLSRMI